MEEKLVAVLDNPESIGFQYVEQLMNAGYKVDYLTNEGSYRLESPNKRYKCIVLLSLDKSTSFSNCWIDKLKIIKEAVEQKIPVIALSSKQKEINKKAGDIGAIVLKNTADYRDLINELENL